MFLAGLLGLFCKKSRKFKFRKRADIKFLETYSSYFAQTDEPKYLIEEIWFNVSQALDVSPTKLRVTDRLDKELKIPCSINFVDDGVVDELYEVLIKYNNGFLPQGLDSVETVGDLIIFLARLSKLNPNNPIRCPLAGRGL